MTADLHCHTRYSDGSLTADELAELAYRVGLDCVAITDHDYIVSCTECENLSKKHSVRIIQGVEVTCTDYKRMRTVHLLCYFNSLSDDKRVLLCDIVDNTAALRAQAEEKIKNKVLELFPIGEDAIRKCMQGSTRLFKQHLIHALYNCGFSDGIYGNRYRELFSKKYGLVNETYSHPDVTDVITAAKKSGCVTVLAHPYVYDSIELLDELTELKLIDGVEAYHTRQTAEQSAFLVKKARSRGILVTGGSDFHGMYSSKPIVPGMSKTADDDLEKFLFRLNQN